VSVGQGDVLLPYQLEFYESFLSPRTADRQLLVAPPGMGKGYVAQRIVHEVADRDSESRVLVLAPASLTAGFAAGLEGLHPAYPVHVVDRRRLRELLSEAREDDIWERPSVVVMSIEFARQEDVRTLLVETEWSLVVVDEAHSLEGARSRLVQQLAGSAARLLLLSAVEPARTAQRIPRLNIVRWTRDAVDAAGRALLVTVPRARHIVDYTRSQEEVALAALLLDLVSEEMKGHDTPQIELIKRVTTNALASSPSVLEHLLLRQRARLAEGSDAGMSWANSGDQRADGDELGSATQGFEAPEESLLWRDPKGAAIRLDDLIARLDALPGDSKATCLREFVNELRHREGAAPICIFTLFASTADYVAEIMGDLPDVRLLTGAMAFGERALTVDEFVAAGGVLIATHAMQGLNLSGSHLAIHYDLPEGSSQMEQRWGRLDRVGQTETVHAFAFRDRLRTLDWEELLLRRHGFIS
jgi:SNF2 family DNA or RNA helicase